jgi:hypothetical protein
MQPALANKRTSKPQLIYTKRGHAVAQALRMAHWLSINPIFDAGFDHLE